MVAWGWGDRLQKYMRIFGGLIEIFVIPYLEIVDTWKVTTDAGVFPWCRSSMPGGEAGDGSSAGESRSWA